MECSKCRAWLAVPRGARSVQCAHCRGVTHVEQHGAVGFVKGVFANMAGGGARRQPQNLFTLAEYPNAHGNKRALLVGVKYTGTKLSKLTGPINDVKFMKFLLCEKFGFPSDSILVLTDEERDPRRMPTKYNIMLAMRWLVHGCSSGDSLVFHFSGHGTRIADQDDDELDGYDEAICPLDSDPDDDGMDIRDDEINEAIVRPLVPGVKLHAIIDACYSGTVLDLPNLCKIKWRGRHQWEDQSPPTGACKNTSGGHAILISGCTDTQLSADDFGVASMGALTHAFFVAAWSEHGTHTYGSLLAEIRATIRDNGNRRGRGLPAPIGSLVRKVVNFSGVQEPQLSSSKKFDINQEEFLL